MKLGSPRHISLVIIITKTYVPVRSITNWERPHYIPSPCPQGSEAPGGSGRTRSPGCWSWSATRYSRVTARGQCPSQVDSPCWGLVVHHSNEASCSHKHWSLCKGWRCSDSPRSLWINIFTSTKAGYTLWYLNAQLIDNCILCILCSDD